MPIGLLEVVTVRLQGIDAPELHYQPIAALGRREEGPD